MPNENTLSIIVKLQDEASAGLASMAATMEGLGTKVAGAASSISQKFSDMGASMVAAGGAMKSAGTQLTTGLTLPIVGIGYEVVTAANKFQQSMELIRTQAGASQAEVDHMSKAVLDLSKSGETAQGPQKLAEGLFHIESLGYRGSQALDILKTSAEAADVGVANLEDVANALGASLVTGIKGTQDANQAMGILNATIGAGNMKMQDLAAALGTGILPSAKVFGLTLTDVGAALATLTDNGMRADEAATRLRMTFSLMAAPSKKAQEALASIGLSQLQLANDMRSGGITSAIDDLNAHLNGVSVSHEKIQKGTKMTAAAMDELKLKIADAQEKLKILNETHIKSVPILDAHGKVVKDITDKTAAHTVAVDRHNLAVQTLTQEIAKYQAKLEGANTVVETMGGKMLTASQKALVLSEAFGGGRTSAAILTLVEQSDRLHNKFTQITNDAGTFNDAVAATHAENQYKLNAALASMQATMIDIGGTVAPMVAAAMQHLAVWLQNISTWWDKQSPAMKTFIVDALAIAAAVGPLLVILGTLVSVFGRIFQAISLVITVVQYAAEAFAALMAVDPIVLAIVAVVAALGFAAYEMWKHWDVVKGFFLAMWNDLKAATKIAIDVIVGLVVIFLNTMVPGWRDALHLVMTIWRDAWGYIRDFFVTIGNAIEDAIGAVMDWITNKINAVIGAWQTMVQILSKPVQTGLGAVGSALGAVGGVISKAAGAVVSAGKSVTHFEMGGYVNAPHGTEVPAILHGGEEIITAENAQSRRGGSTVNIIINNPSVRSNADIAEMRRQVEAMMRPLLRNAKVVHA